MTLRAGDLKKRLTFYKKVTAAADELGNTQLTWEAQFTLNAELRLRVGGETVTQARLSGKNVAVISVRNSRDAAAITTDWKAVDTRNDVEWNIRSVLESFDRSAIEMLAETGVTV